MTRPTPRRPIAAPPQGNQHARRTGAQATGANLPTWEQVRADVSAIVDECPWLQGPDGLILEVFAQELATYRHAAVALQQLRPDTLNKKLSAQKLQIRRARVLGELADRLGLSPQSRFRIGYTAARTQTELRRVTPVRSEERALQVAEILSAARALPPASGEVIEAAAGEDQSFDETPDLRAVDKDGT